MGVVCAVDVLTKLSLLMTELIIPSSLWLYGQYLYMLRTNEILAAKALLAVHIWESDQDNKIENPRAWCEAQHHCILSFAGSDLSMLQTLETSNGCVANFQSTQEQLCWLSLDKLEAAETSFPGPAFLTCRFLYRAKRQNSFRNGCLLHWQ